MNIADNIAQIPQISDDILTAFKDKMHLRYAKYISDINKCNGYIEIELSQDGKNIKNGKLIADDDTLDKFHNDLNSL